MSVILVLWRLRWRLVSSGYVVIPYFSNSHKNRIKMKELNLHTTLSGVLLGIFLEARHKTGIDCFERSSDLLGLGLNVERIYNHSE